MKQHNLKPFLIKWLQTININHNFNFWSLKFQSILYYDRDIGIFDLINKIRQKLKNKNKSGYTNNIKGIIKSFNLKGLILLTVTFN